MSESFGKPLTAFETFKARFEELLKELFPAETRKVDRSDTFFALRMDTQRTDFFWGYKNNTHTFDEALMNLLWALVRVNLTSMPTMCAAFLGDRYEKPRVENRSIRAFRTAILKVPNPSSLTLLVSLTLCLTASVAAATIRFASATLVFLPRSLRTTSPRAAF